MRARLVAILTLAAALAAGGCGADTRAGSSGPTSPPSDPATVLTLPTSTGAPLLTFTGRLAGARPAPSAGGVGGGAPVVTLDRAAIDSLNRVSCRGWMPEPTGVQNRFSANRVILRARAERASRSRACEL